MQFNSLIFIIFGIIFFALWPFFRGKNNPRWIFLVAASFIFYGWWDWRFIFLIIGSGLIDFFAGLGIERFKNHRKLILVISMIGNIGSLAVFKYLNFGINNINWLLKIFGIDSQIPVTHLILPVGISFYTFQSMSYTIDIYRGQLKPTRNIFHFFAYLSLFPQLVAGPIVRASELLPQLERYEPVSEKQRWDGLWLIVFGFFKKVIVADTLAKVVNEAFTATAPADSFSYWWIIMIMFAFQIFCDFSGYSDIAIGLGKWIGYEFPINFKNPYISSSFREFWQRWHISLSTWFRDYVYIPLGGSKTSKFHNHITLWITMIVSGLWHGAAWHFILWGAAHSFFLSLERITNWPKKLTKLPAGRHITTLMIFLLTTLAWVFFRAENLSQVMYIFGSMFNPFNFNYAVTENLIGSEAFRVLFIIIGSQLFFYLGLDKAEWAQSESKFSRIFEPALLAFIIMVCVYMHAPSNTFIYFQF